MQIDFTKEDVVKIISLMQAIVDGKTLQTSNGNGGWCDVKEVMVNDLLCYFNVYRIKPEENYTIEQNCGENRVEGGVLSVSGSVSENHLRPFKSCEELIHHVEAYYLGNNRPNGTMPLIWIKSKEYGTDNLITAFDNNKDSIGGSCVFFQDIWLDMKELFDNFTFLDGSPCGVEE